MLFWTGPQACTSETKRMGPDWPDQLLVKDDWPLCHAGIAGQPYKQSKQGYEQEFAVITLGHWLLVNKLLDTLVASQARVVVVASHLHSLASDCTPDYRYSTAIIGGWLAYCRR